MTLSLVAFVGLESTFYQVNESAGSIEVCAAVSPVSDCPVAAPFNIIFTTLNDTAGKTVHSYSYSIELKFYKSFHSTYTIDKMYCV